MNAFVKTNGRRVAFAVLLIFLLAACAHPLPLPFSCANFKETYWAEFNFGVDSPTDVASTAARLWGIDLDSIRVVEQQRRAVTNVGWLDRKIYGTLGAFNSWIREGVLIKFESLWQYPTPTLSRAIDCLGEPEHYIAFTVVAPDNPFLHLDLVYPDRGIVVHYFGGYTAEPIHPDMQIVYMSVVASGATEEVVQATYSIGAFERQQFGYATCLLKAWPGSFEAIEVASSRDFFQCLPDS